MTSWKVRPEISQTLTNITVDANSKIIVNTLPLIITYKNNFRVVKKASNLL